MTSSCIVPTAPRNPCGISRFVTKNRPILVEAKQYHFAPIDPKKKALILLQNFFTKFTKVLFLDPSPQDLSPTWVTWPRIGHDVNFFPKKHPGMPGI